MGNKEYTAALIIIGDEILSGRTKDANLNYIAKELVKLGIRFKESRVIPDDDAMIVDVVNHLRGQYDYVFTTGGIGPTHDDITTECIAKAFGVELYQDEDTIKIMEKYYAKIGEKLNEGRIKMATFPKGAVLIENPVTIAPGFSMENVYVFAGIPDIMRAMFDAIKYDLTGGLVVKSKELRASKSESKIAGPLAELQASYENVDIGSYPFFEGGSVGVVVVLRSTDEKTLDEVYEKLEKILN